MAERLISAERREVSTPPAETRMWAKQAALPRLPVPDLGQTCMRYLRSVRPLLSGDEYRATLDAVAADLFAGRAASLIVEASSLSSLSAIASSTGCRVVCACTLATPSGLVHALGAPCTGRTPKALAEALDKAEALARRVN